MRFYVLILVAFLVSTFAFEVNAKTKQKEVKDKETKPQFGKNVDSQENAGGKQVFEKARVRYNKPKNKVETSAAKSKKQETQYNTNKKYKSVDDTRSTKNKHKPNVQEEVVETKKSKKNKYTKSANTNEALQEEVGRDHKVTKDKRTKRDAAAVLEKQRLKKVKREEVGIEEQSEEICPPCDCANRGEALDEIVSNKAEEEVSTTEEVTEEQSFEEDEENLQCDSLAEGCDV